MPPPITASYGERQSGSPLQSGFLFLGYQVHSHQPRRPVVGTVYFDKYELPKPWRAVRFADPDEIS